MATRRRPRGPVFAIIPGGQIQRVADEILIQMGFLAPAFLLL